MQTALHIRSLVRELQREITGGEIVKTAFYRKLRAAYLHVKSDSGSWAFGCVFHPGGSGVFLVPGSKLEIDTPEKPWPIFDLGEATVTKVEQIGLDRMFRIEVKAGHDSRAIICEAIGPNGNLWLLDGHDRIIATLRHRDYDPKTAYQTHSAREGLDPFTLTPQKLNAELDRHQEHAQSIVTFIEKRVLGFNRTLAREAAVRADVESASTHEMTPSRIDTLSTQITALAQMFDSDHAAYLHTVRGDLKAYPFKLHGDFPQPPEKFKTLSLAVVAMISSRQTSKTEVDESKIIISVAAKEVERLEIRA
ncbi:MAG: NFACT family protein [candidate division Zixibacteria bacterium]|nr:NFACT family protein [candidate division Zixibacteria bacterium]